MGSLGYEPSLDAVSNGAAAGVTTAFTTGLRNTFLVLGGLLALGIALSSLTSERLPGRAAGVRSGA